MPWHPRQPPDEDVDREIRDHLDLEAEDRAREGLPADQAARAARLAFGNPAVVREDVRAAWGWGWIEDFVLDVRHALRLWARNPAFSTIAVITVALGIGASTAIVSQINAVFWKRLPVSNPSELRLIAWTSPRPGFVGGPNVLAGPKVGGLDTFGSFSYAAYVAMRDGSKTFSDLACWADLGEARPVVLGDLGFGAVQFVSGNYFRALGIGAALGRTIQPEDDVPGSWSPVAVISHAFWTRVLGQSPTVTQHKLELNGQPFAIVGVLPPGFFGMDPATSPDVVIPMSTVQVAAATTNPLANARLWNVCRTFGRLLPGVSEAEAGRELEAWAAHAIATAPASPGFGTMPGRDAYDPPRIWLVDGSRGLATLRDAASVPLLVLFAVVVGLLLAACANIAGLLLARGSARERELATRLALGAPRSRVVRQLITESLVLSLLGGALGLAVSQAMSGLAPKFLSQLMPTLYGADRSLSVSATLDLRVFLFGATAALAAGLLFGILPAVRVTRVNLITTIRQATAGATHRVFGLNAGHVMVMAQTALAMMLLVSAGLLLKTVGNLRETDLGFRGEGLLYARVEPRSGRLPNDQRGLFFQNAAKRLQTLPGVVSASAATTPPIGGSINVGIASEGMPICPPFAGATTSELVRANAVLPGYFDTLGVPIVSGRDFSWTDNQQPKGAPAIISQALANRYFAGQDPIGRSLRLGPCDQPFGNIPIVGVVSDMKVGLRGEPEPILFLTLQGAGSPVTLVVRTTTDAAAMIPSVRRAMRELNAEIPTFSEATFVNLRERQLRRERLLSDLVSLFGSVTLLVCCLGIYGLLSYSVARRRAEISVRMAIGASAPSIVSMVVRESLLPVCVGIVIGAIGAILATRQIQGVLFGVSSGDPWVIVGAAALFILVAATAAALPARSATKVDPLLALRQ